MSTRASCLPDVKAVWVLKHVLIPVGGLVQRNDALTRPVQAAAVGGAGLDCVAVVWEVMSSGTSTSVLAPVQLSRQVGSHSQH